MTRAADAAADPYTALWALACGTGMRQGEILGLRWPDIDIDHARLTVKHSLIRLSKEVRLVEPKTESSKRVVRLDPKLVARLVSHRKAEVESALESGRSYDLKSYVFRRKDGQPVSAAMVLKAWHHALRRAELPIMPFHSARHSVATTLIARTGNPKMAADVLGHSDVATTLRMYAHTTPRQHEQAAAILGEAL